MKRLNTSPYLDRKDRNKDRVPGTCNWFVQHQIFRDWQEKTSGVLWVSADPGCGKSVLAKYLVDSVLPATSRTVCYFFFKDDFEDQRGVIGALCCLLHQLFRQKPELLSDAILKHFELLGERLTSSFGELWNALVEAAEDRNAGEIVCLLDAIDECEAQGRSQLYKAIRDLYETKKTASSSRLKLLLTSRPYGDIRRGFRPLIIRGLPVIHLSGESEEEVVKISQEIGVFIRSQVQDIGDRLKLTESEKRLLLSRLMAVPNRTYLWVHLTLDLIENDIDINKAGIIGVTTHLPRNLDEAYDRILSKSRDIKKAKRILHIVVAAARPLALSEMNLALSLEKHHRCYNDIELQTEDRFREKLRDICGLFITVFDSKIYLLHQTAKEFLVLSAEVRSGIRTGLRWKHAFLRQKSHRILAEICIQHLSLQEFAVRHLHRDRPTTFKYVYASGNTYIFLDYSAKHWATHVRELGARAQDAIASTILGLCDTTSNRCNLWLNVYWTSTNTDFPRGFTTLMVVSYFGLSTVVKLLLTRYKIDVNVRDDVYRRSALSWAAGNGFDDVVEMLIKGRGHGLRNLRRLLGKGTEIDASDVHDRTPLSYAVWSGNAAVVKMLVKAGARVDSRDRIGGTPLSYAICNGQRDMIELLLRKRAAIGSKDEISKKLFQSAVVHGHEPVVRLLLDAGADAEVRNVCSQTPLHQAVGNCREAILKMLLDAGVDKEAQDQIGRTPLFYAVEHDNRDVLSMLLDAGANKEVKDNVGRTPLSYAAECGYEAIVRILVEAGADREARDVAGRTPLSYAAEHQYMKAVVQVLIDAGANKEVKDRLGQTPLHLAVQNGNPNIIWILIDAGVEKEAKNRFGQTPLIWAVENERDAVVRLLIEAGANAEAKNPNGQTPLLWAVESGHKAVAKLLLDAGADTEARNIDGQTPLIWAVQNDNEAFAKLLIDAGANKEARMVDGETPLLWAVRFGREALAKLLIHAGADLDAVDRKGQTPLIRAAYNGHDVVVTLLIHAGADRQERDSEGYTALQRAIQKRHQAVERLLTPRLRF
ncbi:hypothetical protein CDD83_123 [Cordyceps sp. RAO-2017]|nr:hypothetical protein CDD83_123 [Cordyceps sp. RAO-2017]